MQGVTLHASYYTPSSGNASTYQDFGIKVKPEMVEGLEIGYAFGTSEATAGTEVDESTMYVKYAVGAVTVGYQTSDFDAPTTTDSDDSVMWGISYAVNDSFSIAYILQHLILVLQLLIKNLMVFLLHTLWVELQLQVL